MAFKKGEVHNGYMIFILKYLFAVVFLELGSGGYGEVFEVEKESNKKRMAMKVMKISKENKKNSKACCYVYIIIVYC
jgi:hypothetical protein